MDKLLEHVKKELEEIGEQGLTSNNLPTADKLVDIYKDIKEIEKMEGGSSMDYRTGGYRNSYWNGDYNDYGRSGMNGGTGYNMGDYGRRGVAGSGRGGYRGNDPRMRDHFERMAEGVEEYEYGRERYMHGDSEARIYEGLEKMMYAVCSFMECAMEFAESPQEKEIIRKHIQKMQRM